MEEIEKLWKIEIEKKEPKKKWKTVSKGKI